MEQSIDPNDTAVAPGGTQPHGTADTRPAEAGGYGSRPYMIYVLFLLLLVYALYGMHRSILFVLVEPIKNELHFSDSQIGIIAGPAFSISFAIAGIPFGLLADRVNRRNLVALVVACWSIATGLCGAAQNMLQMAIGRAAVGTAISGGPPACMAMISDIFPAKWRATAISVFFVGGAIGTVAAFGGGAWLAAHYGWRVTFAFSAVPGLIVAALLYFSVTEPVRGLSDGEQHASKKLSIRETFGFIYRQRSVCQILAGLICLHVAGYGLMAFLASFLIRSHGMTLSEAGSLISLLYFVISPISQLGAGLIADYLGRLDIRWRLRLGPLGSIFCLLAMGAMTLVDSRAAAAACFGAWILGAGFYQGPLYALLQTAVKPQMRATMGAIQFVLTGALGAALGPLFVGAVSDLLAPAYGADSLRYALSLVSLFYLWAAIHFILGERRLAADIARAEQA